MNLLTTLADTRFIIISARQHTKAVLPKELGPAEVGVFLRKKVRNNINNHMV